MPVVIQILHQWSACDVIIQISYISRKLVIASLVGTMDFNISSYKAWLCQ